LDGENGRIYWNGEQALWSGKTNKFVPQKEYYDFIESHFLEERFEEVFGRDKEVYIFGEFMGPKVQGNELGLKEKIFIIYDIQIGNIWLEENSIREIADKFQVTTCYDYLEDKQCSCDQKTLDDWIGSVAGGEFNKWEGVVIEPVGQLRDRSGKRIICKVKNKDYLIPIER